MSGNNKKNMEDARKFLWEDDESGVGRNSGSAAHQSSSRGFSTREFAVDQSVNLMDMNNSSGRDGTASSMSSRLSGTITGLFRGSTTAGSGNEEYGDAAPSADAEEYISDKHRRLSPVWAAIANATDSFKISLERYGIRGTKLWLCLLVGFGLLGGGVYMAVSSPNGNTVAPGEQVVITDAARYNAIKQRIVEANVSPKAVLEASSSSPQSMALAWIAEQDPAQLKTDHPALLDRYSLAVFYFMSNQNASNEQWTNADGWLTESGICAWYGIECIPREQEATKENDFHPSTSTYDDNDRVTAIVLKNNGIVAEIPEEWGIALDRLITLNLAENELSHTVPSTLGQLENLRTLILGSNQLTGTLKSEIGMLSDLHQLDFSSNHFEGALPPSWSQMKQLRQLALSHNLLNGKLPNYIGEMTHLRGFFAGANDFSGDLSFVANLGDLMDLRLQENRFSGELTHLSSLHNIETIQLDDNEFQATLPDIFDSIYRIREFSVRSNSLFGSIPSHISHLNSLKSLSLAHNKFNSTIPEAIGLLKDAVTIEINNNQLTGPIPSSLGMLEDLVHISLHANSLTGNVPSELAQCFRLEELNIAHNKLQGTVPPQLGQLSQLEKFRLQGNSIEDTMPPQICALRDFELYVLTADCAEGGKITCDCCSECD